MLLLLPGVAALTAGLVSALAAGLQLLSAARRPTRLEKDSPYRREGALRAVIPAVDFS
jgi:hypothetical protein